MEGLDFAVTLDDQVSASANAAAKSIDGLGGAISHASHSASEGLHAITEGFIRVVEPAEVVKGAFEGVGDGMRSMVAGLKGGEAKEVVAGLSESIAGLAQMLDLLIPGLGQAAAAVIRFGGAFAAATVGIIQKGMELAIEATSAKAALIDTFSALEGGAEKGRETEEMLSGLSRQLGVTKDILAPLTVKFAAMGIEGEESLKRLTTAAVSAQAIMGSPAAADAFENLTKKIQIASETGHGLKIAAKGLGTLATMGLTVDDVAKRMGVSAHDLSNQLKAGTADAAKFGEAMTTALIDKGAKPLDRMGKSLGSLKAMLGQSIDDMFEDMGKAVEPFLSKLKDMLSIFDQANPSGQVMKGAIEGAFGAMLRFATSSVDPIIDLFLDVEIASLKVAIAVKTHWADIRQVFAGVQPVLELIVSTLGHVVSLMGKVSDLKDRISGGTAGALAGHTGGFGDSSGANVGKGLADGMRGQIADVRSAGKDLGEAAKAGVTGEPLKIQSPSRGMMIAGGHVGAGLAIGMDASQGRVEAAASNLGASAHDTIRAAPAGGGKSGAPGHVTINITAPDGVTNTMELTEMAVAALFERFQLHEGV